ncbi:hypothetical protein [Polaromonas sp. C04]|uniref:hypothetical protein n=1 Tax=Polaromonas sp. C04 TaxID=1945857 RepID=UPI001185C35D|nr:hypothetical protein [Polaromonas sp. C04]
MPRISKAFIAPLLCGLLVTACGGSTGGGTGAPTSAAATTFPLSIALLNLDTTGVQKTLPVSGTAIFNATGSSYDFTGSLDFTETPANAGSNFENQAARQIDSSLTGAFNINGANNSFSSINQSFLSANNLLLGISSAKSYCTPSASGQFPDKYPDTVTIGQAQLVVIYDCYQDGTKTSPVGTGKVSFLVSAGNSPETATFSTMETFTDTTGLQTQYTQKNYLIDTSGNISFLTLSFLGFLTSSNNWLANGIQLNFKSQ